MLIRLYILDSVGMFINGAQIQLVFAWYFPLALSLKRQACVNCRYQNFKFAYVQVCRGANYIKYIKFNKIYDNAKALRTLTSREQENLFRLLQLES